MVTITTTPENQDELVVPSVTISSTAAGSGTTTITSLKERDTFLEADIPGYLGAAFDFTTDAPFDEAQLTFSYDKSIVSEDFRPEIF